LVIFVIRTRKTPFYKSKPSRLLLLSSFGILVVAFVLPFTQLGKLFEFVALPIVFFIILIGMIAVYLVLVEVVKKWFYSRYRY
jgi:Mg2+-importing ATPase